MKYSRYPEYRPSGVDWLGEVPVHWEVKRLKFAVELTGEKVDEMPDDGRYVALEHIESWTGKRLEGDGDLKPESHTNQFREGDVLFGKLRPYLAKVWRANFDGYSSGELLVLRQHDLLPDFAKYFCLSRGFIDLVNSSTYGSKMPRANWDFIGNQLAVIPPLDEQHAIVAFLDRETARIDALIATKRRFIALLQEKRVALISRAVTRGLDADAPLKDSGVEWFGQIPRPWRVMRLRHLTEEVTVGIVVTPSKYYEDTGVPALRSLNIKPGAITTNELVFIGEDANDLHSKSKLRAGDLVAVRTGQPGTTAIVPSELDGANCIDLIIIRKSPHFDSRYLCFFMNSDAAIVQFSAGSGGALQQHFNIQLAKDLVIPLPPKDEQWAITEFLDRETDRIDAMTAKNEAAIERLSEYRSSLIAYAVAGRIDTREHFKAERPNRHPRKSRDPVTSTVNSQDTGFPLSRE